MTLAGRCIEITSQPGDTVLDPYAGSGTTLIAAQELGRNWAGIELNPAYINLIKRRLPTPTSALFCSSHALRLKHHLDGTGDGGSDGREGFGRDIEREAVGDNYAGQLGKLGKKS